MLLPARSRIEIERALALARALQVKPILFGGHEGFEASAAIAAAGAPVVLSLDWPAGAKDPDPEAHETLRALRLRDRAPTTPEALRAAGVPFAFATEALDDPAGALAAVKKAVDAGLPRDAAVRALTLDAARIYGVGDRLGSLDVGKIANLLVTEGELFTEGARLDSVVVDGRIFELEARKEVETTEQETAPEAVEPGETAAATEPAAMSRPRRSSRPTPATRRDGRSTAADRRRSGRGLGLRSRGHADPQRDDPHGDAASRSRAARSSSATAASRRWAAT